jgi:hypothetical protein
VFLRFVDPRTALSSLAECGVFVSVFLVSRIRAQRYGGASRRAAQPGAMCAEAATALDVHPQSPTHRAARSVSERQPSLGDAGPSPDDVQTARMELGSAARPADADAAARPAC